MVDLHLVLGNKNYSSWSLRAWILCAHASLNFTETVIPLFTPEGSNQLQKLTPAGLVPVLLIDGVSVWDSLAIAEALAERFPEKRLWPEETNARAVARSVSAEMHSGFFHLRQSLPMNCRASKVSHPINQDVEEDLRRIEKIWSDCRNTFGGTGDWLFGDYSIADAMYAPVVSRCFSYGVTMQGVAKDYMHTAYEDPLLKRWYEDAAKEPWRIAACDAAFL